MADTIKLFGSNVPKPLVIGGGAAIIIGGIFYYRKNQANAASQASVNAAGSSEIDPATGYPYGSAEDAAALSAQGDYQNPIQGAYGFAGYGGGAAANFGSGAPGSFANNAEWAQFVENYEINNTGGDSAAVGNAIGKYISGQPLTTDAMVSLVQQAIAIGGYPPTSGPNGHPPGYVTALPGSTIPPPISTAKAGVITGLKQTAKTRTSFTVAWNATPASGGYTYMVKQINGKIVKQGTTSSHSVNITGMHPAWSYNFSIHGNPNGPGNSLHIPALPK